MIYCLKAQFARHGIPSLVYSDNAFATAEFRDFATKYDFEQAFSSPRFPSSNGKSENAVKTAKRIMTKAVESSSDPFLALLDWRNTPSENLHKSPAQILYGRRTRTRLPMPDKLLDTADTEAVRKALMEAKARQATYYNVGAKDRPPLQVGQSVRVKYDASPEWRKAQISKRLPFRSYEVTFADGTTRRRTSKHVRFSAEPPDVVQDDGPPLTAATGQAPAQPTQQPGHQHQQPQATSKDAAQRTSRELNNHAAGQPTTVARHNTTRSGRLVVKPARYRDN